MSLIFLRNPLIVFDFLKKSFDFHCYLFRNHLIFIYFIKKLFDVLFPVFFVIGVGYYLGVKDPKFDTKFITNFAGNIGTPAMIFYTITTTGVTLSVFIEYFIYALIIIGGFSRELMLNEKIFFVIGAASASFIYFFSLGYASSYFATFINNQKSWQLINRIIIFVMLLLSIFVIHKIVATVISII